MLSEQELMRIHVEALFTHDDHLRLQFVNEPNGAPAPRFFLGRTAQGNIWRFRSDLPGPLVEHLEALCLDEPVVNDLGAKPYHFEAYVRLLETHVPVQNLWTGPAYRFPEKVSPPLMHLVAVTRENAEVLRPGFQEWVPDIPYRRPFLARLQAGRAVSLCCSVRITSEAHEAGVETLAAARGRGCASDVVAGWANEVRKMGCIPLYSTSWENTASQGVAKRLGLVPYGVDYHVK